MTETSTPTSPDRGVSYLYMAAAFVIVVAGMRAAESIINPLLLAVFLSVISAPAYFGLLRRGIASWLALLIVVAVLSAVVLGVVLVVMESIAGFTSRQAEYRELLHERTSHLRREVQDWMPDWMRDAPNRREPAVPLLTDPARPVVAAATNLTEDDGRDDESESPDSTTHNPADTAATVPPSSKAIPPPDDESTVAESNLLDSGPAADAAVAPDADTDSKEASDEEDEGPALPDPTPLPTGGQLPSFGFPEPTQKLPDSEQGWLERMWEQFNFGSLISLAAALAGSIGAILSNAFLILLTVIFILLEASTFPGKMKAAFVHTDEATQRARQIVDSIQHYIVIKTWVSLATGLAIALWLTFLGVPYAKLWGLLAFLFNYIPNVGSIIAAIPAVLIAWLELTTLPAVATAVGFLLVNGSVGNFIEPRLMGRGLGLSPLIVFFSMVFWGFVLGPIGMVLSVPLTMTARIAMEGFDDSRWIAILMGNAD